MKILNALIDLVSFSGILFSVRELAPFALVELCRSRILGAVLIVY